MRSIVITLALTALAGTASAQLAGVNGLHMAYGNGFNHFPSTINTTNNGLAGVRLQESMTNATPTDPEAGSFSNRHFAFLSSDGGATTYAYDGVSSFSISYRHRVTSSTSSPVGSNNSEGGLWFLQGGEANSFADGGIWSTVGGTAFVGGMGTGFSLLAEGNGSNASFPALTVGGWRTFRFDYYAPGALGDGSLASYQASVLDETSGNFRISGITAWDQGSSWPTGLQAGTAIGFRFQDAPIQGANNEFDGEYANIVISAVPAPTSAGALALLGLASLRRRR